MIEILAVPFAKTSNMTPFRMTQARFELLPTEFTVHVDGARINDGRLVVGRFDGLSEGFEVGRSVGDRVDGILVVGLVDVGFDDVGIVVGRRVGMELAGSGPWGAPGVVDEVGFDVVGIDVGLIVGLNVGLDVGLNVGLNVGLDVGENVGFVVL